jgi:hypothetical protein
VRPAAHRRQQGSNAGRRATGDGAGRQTGPGAAVRPPSSSSSPAHPAPVAGAGSIREQGLRKGEWEEAGNAVREADERGVPRVPSTDASSLGRMTILTAPFKDPLATQALDPLSIAWPQRGPHSDPPPMAAIRFPTTNDALRVLNTVSSSY